MKKPDTAKIPSKNVGSSYSTIPTESSAPKPVQREPRSGRNDNRIQKTYSLEKEHVKLINQHAIQLAMARGEPVGASEALREIMDTFSAQSRKTSPAHEAVS